MKKILFVFTLTLLTGFSFGQQGKEVIGKAFNSKGPGAKLELPKTDVVAAKPDPSRADCCINFDNWTGYTLYVWVDGIYRGTIMPYDEDGICVGEGWTTYYIRTAGATYEWSSEGDCRESFVLKLTN